MKFRPSLARALAAAGPLLVIVLCAGALPSIAQAAAPVTVTVRAEGFGTTVLPQTTVTTTGADLTPDGMAGDVCDGGSAGEALYDATQGNWSALYDSSFSEYTLQGVEGLTFPAFSATTPPDAYWSLFLDGQPAQNGICDQPLSNGDQVVVFAQCEAIGPGCTSATSPDNFLTLSGVPAVIQLGASVPVSVGSESTVDGSAEATLPSGTAFTSGTPASPPTAPGTTSLTFPTVGTYTVALTAPDSVPSTPFTVCVHNGNDGNCGTPAPPGSASTPSPTSTTTTAGPTPSAPSSVSDNGRYAVVSRFTDLLDGHTYPRKKAPRTIAGMVIARASVASVSLSLTRREGGRCSAFDGTHDRFVKAKCGHGSLFPVGRSSTFSYLLPAKLKPGRYVLEAQARDSAGNVSVVANGTTRIVFFVR